MAVPPLHVELEPHGLARHKPAVGFLGLLAERLDPLCRVMCLRRIHPDVADLLCPAVQAADLDAVAIDDADDLDNR